MQFGKEFSFMLMVANKYVVGCAVFAYATHTNQNCKMHTHQIYAKILKCVENQCANSLFIRCAESRTKWTIFRTSHTHTNMYCTHRHRTGQCEHSFPCALKYAHG